MGQDHEECRRQGGVMDDPKLNCGDMIFLSPALAQVALEFDPAKICSLMLLGLPTGTTLARGSQLESANHRTSAERGHVTAEL